MDEYDSKKECHWRRSLCKRKTTPSSFQLSLLLRCYPYIPHHPHILVRTTPQDLSTPLPPHKHPIPYSSNIPPFMFALRTAPITISSPLATLFSSSLMMHTNKCIVIEDDFPGYPVEAFCVPQHYEKTLEQILIPAGFIQDRVECMARNIFNHLAGQDVIMLCVLKGGIKFFGDLTDQLQKLNGNSKPDLSVRIQYAFIRLRSYMDDKSTGSVEVIGRDIFPTLCGKNVLIVEDIIDTGTTMDFLMKELQVAQAKTILLAAMLVKRTPAPSGYKPDYVGFEIPDLFVVGYGLDYNEHFRDLHHIGVINAEGKRMYAVSSPPHS